MADDQIDPFADERNDFETKEIRHTKSHNSKNPFVNIINPSDDKARKRNRIILLAVLMVVVAGVLAMLIIPNVSNPNAPVEPEEIVNPTGRKSAIDDAPAFDDPETRKGEQEKLNAVFALMDEGDWEYINALFETIFPDYLDDCGKYDYYRAAVTIADNFEKFTISKDVAVSRAEELLSTCNRSNQEYDSSEE